MNKELNYLKGELATLEEHSAGFPAWLSLTNELDREKKYYIKVEKEDKSISRRMQNYYFGVLIKTILDWNVETGVFLYEGTDEEVVDKDEMDSILRNYFYNTKVVINGKVLKLPKTLKLNKANMSECCEYFDVLKRHFAKQDLFIEDYDFGDRG